MKIRLPIRFSAAKLAATCAGLLGLLLAAAPAHADFAVLRSGQRLEITGWQQQGDTVRLDMTGGSVTVPATDLLTVEPQEIFSAATKHALNVPFADEIRAAAAAYGVDEKLIISVISAESNFNPRAVSPRAAYGLMQLRLETAAHLAVRDVFNPRQNIDGGTRYLKQLLDRYNQNLTLALAAYNAGPERVGQYGGVPPFNETRQYLRRVGAKLQAQNNDAAASAVATR